MRLWARITPVLVLLALPAVASAREISVDPSTLNASLSGLAPGDVVRLATGDYAHFTLSGIVGTAAMPIVLEGPADTSAAIHADPGPCCNTIQIDTNVSYVVIRNLTVDGGNVDGAFGIDARGDAVHHVTIENCTFLHHDASQQTVAISTKTPTSGWLIRGNRILGAGTGMYLGNSDGSDPFVQGIIEHNLIADTIGYGVQIKWQLPHEPVVGADTVAAATLIRHNVFVKTDRLSPDGDRPNLLVGGFPETGPSSEDTYQIYGNVFVHNPRESLLQVSGRSSIHDNVFLDTAGAAINAQDHDLPLRRAWIYNNTIYAAATGIRLAASAPEGSMVVGNSIFAATPIAGSADTERDNITDSIDAAATYVRQPGVVLGAVDFYPLAARATGAALDLSAFASDVEFDRDFNCTSKGDFTFRGAYAGEGDNPGWPLAMENKPAGAGCAAAPSTDGGANGPDAGTISADGGCGCRASRASTSPLFFVILALVAATRRRARESGVRDSRRRSHSRGG